MSLRKMEVQYVGDTLYLPPLERKVKHIIAYNVDINRKEWEYFEKRHTCKFIEYQDNYLYGTDDGYCSNCHETMFKSYAYCPNCGRKVMYEC